MTLQGAALGLCPRDKLFRGYIDLEIQLREFERCRILYEKYLEFGSENCITWIRVNIFYFFTTSICYKYLMYSVFNNFLKNYVPT